MAPRLSISIRRHPLRWYFILAYAITWIGVLPLVASAQGVLVLPVPLQWHAVGALGPVLAALLVTRHTRGRRGVRAFTRRMLRWKVGLGWWLVATLSPIGLLLAAALLLRLAGSPWPDLRALPNAFADPAWVANLVIASVAYGLGEEAGWRGFALPRLQRGRSAFTATLLLTLFWATWHVPFFFYKPEYGFQGLLPVLGFFISLFAGALWLTFLYNSTKGSILMVMLWHLGWNAVSLGSMVVSTNLIAVMSMLVIVLGVGVLLIGGPARLSWHAKYTLEPPEAAQRAGPARTRRRETPRPA